MKKTLILLGAMTVSMIFTACSNVIDNNKVNSGEYSNNNINRNGNSIITLEEAKGIALKHANLEENKVSFIKAKYEFDDRMEKYDIEFYYDNKEYDYEVDAKTGNIIGYDYDVENYSISQQGNNIAQQEPNNTNQQQANNTTQQEVNSRNYTNNRKITVEEAKNIALRHANLKANQVSFIKAEHDYDDGIEKYDIEFYHNNKEYDYEIDAKTGNIIGYDYDVENYSIPQQPNNTNQQKPNNTNNRRITVEEAKNIALRHANLNANQVSFIRAEHDYDDGIAKYDIEFYYNNREYNYEINASNGQIIEYEID